MSELAALTAHFERHLATSVASEQAAAQREQGLADLLESRFNHRSRRHWIDQPRRHHLLGSLRRPCLSTDQSFRRLPPPQRSQPGYSRGRTTLSANIWTAGRGKPGSQQSGRRWTKTSGGSSAKGLFRCLHHWMWEVSSTLFELTTGVRGIPSWTD